MCVFCDKENIASYLIMESRFSYAICSRDPISDAGHFLVLPKRHHEKLSSFRPWELLDLFFLFFNLYMKVNTFHAGAKNMQLNEGLIAGQTVNHVHLHLILRYEDDDIENMRKRIPKQTISAEKISEFRTLIS